jgi:hypothetical protein
LQSGVERGRGDALQKVPVLTAASAREKANAMDAWDLRKWQKTFQLSQFDDARRQS